MDNPDKIAELIQRQVMLATDNIAEKTFYRGVVAAIKGRMVNVYIEGNTTALQNIVCLTSYHPVVGDKVMVLSIGTSGTNFLCIGKIDDTGLVINLITNPSAETNSNGFTVRLGIGGNTVDAGALWGSRAFWAQNAGGGQADFTTGNLITGKQYTLSWYAKKFGSGTGTVTHNGATLYSSSAWTTGYVRYSVTFTATANSPVSINLDIVGSDNSMYLDGIMLTEGPTLYTYFDGANPPAGGTSAWDGTAHASTSRSFVINTDNTLITMSPLTNSWVNYSTVDANWEVAKYLRDNDGMVYLSGLIRAGVVGNTFFTLPVGYRPLKQHLFAVHSNGTIGRVDVYPDGQCKVQAGNNGYVGIDNVIFKAEQ